MGRTYKLYGTAVASTNGLASLRVTKKCKIRSVTWACSAVAGAGTTAQIVFELSKQNTRSITTNDTPETVIDGAILALPIGAASGAINQTSSKEVPADVGDTLYLNVEMSGVAPAAGAYFLCYVNTSE